MTKVLTKMAYWNPDLDFGAAMDSLPEGTDLTVLKECIKPVISSIDEIKRVEASAGIRHPVLHRRCRFTTKTNFIFS